MKGAKFSAAAFAAHGRGERVLIEHVAPLRALTRQVIEKISQGASDAELESFIKDNYELVLLTEKETAHLNGINRSRLDPNRLAKAGILLVDPRLDQAATT
jgi:hypothetical protein